MAENTKKKLDTANEEPKVLTSTRAKYGPARAAKQRTSMILNKARRMGARVPNPTR